MSYLWMLMRFLVSGFGVMGAEDSCPSIGGLEYRLRIKIWNPGFHVEYLQKSANLNNNEIL